MAAKITLIAVEKNLVDEVRRDLKMPPPERPHNKIIYLPIEYTGNGIFYSTNIVCDFY